MAEFISKAYMFFDYNRATDNLMLMFYTLVCQHTVSFNKMTDSSNAKVSDLLAPKFSTPVIS